MVCLTKNEVEFQESEIDLDNIEQLMQESSSEVSDDVGALL
jgi:hypothetical protein